MNVSIRRNIVPMFVLSTVIACAAIAEVAMFGSWGGGFGALLGVFGLDQNTANKIGLLAAAGAYTIIEKFWPELIPFGGLIAGILQFLSLASLLGW